MIESLPRLAYIPVLRDAAERHAGRTTLPITILLWVRPNGLRAHNLVRALLFEQPVLMDAGRMRKGISAHDSFIGLDHHAGDLAHEAAGF